MDVKYHHITPNSYVDGPGARTVLFMQGCPIGCPGCQNPHLWPSDAPEALRADAEVVAGLLWSIAGAYQREGHNVTISGGEPFLQPQALFEIVRPLRELGAHIVVYTGLVFEDLWVLAKAEPVVFDTLKCIDVLVDGPYDYRQDDAFMQWRGSRNQRPIDVPATLCKRHTCRRPPLPVVLDWDTPQLVITPGRIFGAEGVMMALGIMGRKTRRCGQTA